MDWLAKLKNSYLQAIILAYKPVMKTGAKRVPWICALIIPQRRAHKNDYSKRARDSVAPDSLYVALLNDALALCECWSGVKLQ